ncbi:hypothetical protein BD626DRAFT_486582 [Schizophyllum amplum]|uniref:DRBM domain-containing protein n=1 Tax=Schizophyllum amplum TaxID=97359 RepID=A0A550CMQ2_9AGAR|nr:hypothetical protein BD626DRAFT_486582 [Auriculariopsis ampla]
MAGLPPLPKIEGDLDCLLDVFTHDSLRDEGEMGQMNNDYGNTARLREVGERVLELAVTFHYYNDSQDGMLTAEEIVMRRQEALSNDKINHWMDAYELKAKIKAAPSERAAARSSPELNNFFKKYVGAIYVRQGMDVVQTWISRLLNPDIEPILAPGRHTSPPQQQHQHYQQQQDVTMAPPPPPPTTAPPPMPAGAPPGTPAPMIPGGNGVTLSLMNQTAMQKGFAVNYDASQTGPPHAPTWSVRCILNGNEYGTGTGTSQKKAKELAAKEAFERLGWARG